MIKSSFYNKILDKSFYRVTLFMNPNNGGHHGRYKDCIHCGETFRLDSQRKKRVGGKINECPDCVEELQTETAPIIRGFVSGSAKQATISFVMGSTTRRMLSVMARLGEPTQDGIINGLVD